MSTSSIPLYGRAWDIVVTSQDGERYTLSQSGWEPEALRVVFEVLQTTLPSPYWFADIAVYNLDLGNSDELNILLNASWVTLSAGYQSGSNQSSVIWSGPVIQVLYDQENVVDRIIRFNCMAIAGKSPDGSLLNDAIVNQTNGILASQMQVIEQMISSTNQQFQASTVAQSLMSKRYPRGVTLFGPTWIHLEEVADDNMVSWWRSGDGTHNISELYVDPSTLPDVTYSPAIPPGSSNVNPNPKITYSIVGIPKQSVFGCIFTVLLDPRLRVTLPPMLVKIDNAIIQQLKISIGQFLRRAPCSIIAASTSSGRFVTTATRARTTGTRRSADTELAGLRFYSTAEERR